MNSANLGHFAAIEMSGALDAREVSAMELAISAIARNDQIDGAINAFPYMSTVSPVGREKDGLPIRVQGIRTLFENRTSSGSWNRSGPRSAGSKCDD